MNTASGMIAHEDGMVMDFGSYGLWWVDNRKEAGAWQRISALSGDAFMSYKDTFLVIDFGTVGLWEFDTSGMPGSWAAWNAAWTQPKLDAGDADNTGNTFIGVDIE